MSLLFYISLIFLRIAGIYLCLNVIISIVINLFKKSRNRKTKKYILSIKLALLLLISLFLIAYVRQAFFQSYTDWRPEFTKENIVGKWKKGNCEIVFEKNNFLRENFNNTISNKSQDRYKYTWDLESSMYSIKVIDDRGEVFTVFRVILFCDELRLLEQHEDEPVLINLGYAKISK